MNKEKNDYFRGILINQLMNLTQEGNKTLKDLIKENDNVPDENDLASLFTDHNLLLRFRDRERKLISKIKEALERLDDGSYGVCERCSEMIDEKRLIARPVTTYCIECKIEMEEEEKRMA